MSHRRPKKTQHPKAASKPTPASQPPKSLPPPEGELLDMAQAIGLLKTSRPTFYRWLREGKIKGMKLGRQWRFYREDVERFLKGQGPRIDLPADLSPLIDTLRKRVEELGARDVAPADASDVARAVSLMIRLGVALGASDFHLEPHFREAAGGTVAVLRYRIDGVLHPVADIDIRLLPAIDERWKSMAACDVHEKARPQDGRIMLKLNDIGRTIDLRVSFLPATLGPSVTVRVLDPEVAHPLDLDRLAFSPRDKERLLRAIEAPWGLVLVTGPAGCGKTTTLYASLSHLAGPDRKIMTVEDPVEMLLPWVLQTQLRGEGATYATSVRAFLRSAPNAMMVGEVRDRETAVLCLQAALTGHLVFSALHTNDAPQTLIRLVQMGCDPFLVADATRLVVAQRLIRRLCPRCGEPQEPPVSRIEWAADRAAQGGIDWAALGKAFRGPRGCPECHQTGYRGREVIAETLEVTPQIAAALRRGASPSDLRAIAVAEGMTTMTADGIRRAAEGTTSLEEVLRVVRGE